MPLSPWPAVRPQIVFSIFALIAVLSTAAEVVASALRGPAIPFGESIARQSFVWLLFGALAFVAIWAAKQFPLERPRLRRNAPVHLATFLAISFTHTLLYSAFMRFVLRPELSDAEGPLLGNLLGSLRGDVFIYGMMIGSYYLYAFTVRRQMLTPPVGMESVRRR